MSALLNGGGFRGGYKSLANGKKVGEEGKVGFTFDKPIGKNKKGRVGHMVQWGFKDRGIDREQSGRRGRVREGLTAE